MPANTQILPNLNKGNRVGVIAPAGKVDKKLLEDGINILEKASGFKVIRGKHLTKGHHYFSATDEERLEDLQDMADDEDLKAIFCARGGYGTVRLLDKLNWDKFRAKPKWLIGFSDITVLHLFINKKLSLPSLHAAMPVQYSKNDSFYKSMLDIVDILEGKKIDYEINEHPYNQQGEASGHLIGGNLSIICSMAGTYLEPDWQGKILFIEEIGEQLYKIDRMLYQLKLCGALSKIKGMVIGQFTDIKDTTVPFGQALEDIIKAHIPVDIPVVWNLQAGHGQPNMPLILGTEINLKVDEHKKAMLKWI